MGEVLKFNPFVELFQDDSNKRILVDKKSERIRQAFRAYPSLLYEIDFKTGFNEVFLLEYHNPILNIIK